LYNLEIISLQGCNFQTGRLAYNMNELLRDLINMGKVVAFIDDMIVGMESKEEYNELVEKVIKRLGRMIYM